MASPKFPARFTPRCLSIALFASGALGAACVSAQQTEKERVDLRLDRRIQQDFKIEKNVARFLFGDRMEGVEGERAVVEGNATLRQRGVAVSADRVEYVDATETATATGNVTMNRLGDIVTGPKLWYNLSEERGEMESPLFTLPKNQTRRIEARGSASKVTFLPDNKNELYDARYTTCEPGKDDWYMRVQKLDLDNERQVGTASNATVVFKGVPILYAPWLTFPLNNDRKSGFLSPTFVSSNTSGFQMWLPYYWNIAENRDATFTTKLLTKRGIQEGGEFRYLEKTFRGQIDGEYLPNDREADRDRYLLSWKHEHMPFADRFPGLSVRVDAQRVSDDDYFRDLTTRLQLTSQTTLPRDLNIGYAWNNWAFGARAVGYQVLQDKTAASPIPIPYKTVPQFVANGGGSVMGGPVIWNVTSEWSQFRHPTLVGGQRFIAYPQFTLPIEQPFAFVTPKFGVHATRYNVDRNAGGFDDNVTRTLPIFSVDSGIIMERPVSYRGRDFTQTLEPRAYYVKIPFKDQTRIPNFTTAQTDFNFSQLFTENTFVGGDRINNADQLTLAAVSRFIEKETGEERLKATIGQRYYFQTPRVSLTGEIQDIRRTDILAALSGQITRDWYLDSGVQINLDRGGAEKSLIAARYAPEPGKVFNAAYRYTRAEVRQADLSAQWPFRNGWTGLARWNYSFNDRKLVEGLAGFEYNDGCWIVRALAHRFTTATQQVSTSFQVQLELTGLSRIGVNPLETLRQNIYGYKRQDEIDRMEQWNLR